MTLEEAIDVVLRADVAGHEPFVRALRTYWADDVTVDQYRAWCRAAVEELLGEEGRRYADAVLRKLGPLGIRGTRH